jgi:hypothetical protein
MANSPASGQPAQAQPFKLDVEPAENRWRDGHDGPGWPAARDGQTACALADWAGAKKSVSSLVTRSASS